MDKAKALREARVGVAVNEAVAPLRSAWRHKKTRHKYVVQMHAIIEANLEPAVLYCRLGSNSMETWCRPAKEFFDGRFERI